MLKLGGLLKINMGRYLLVGINDVSNRGSLLFSVYNDEILSVYLHCYIQDENKQH